MRALVAVLAALACGAEPWPNGSCEAVCRGLQCEVTATACFEAAALYGCACEGCADCRPAGRNTTPGCAHPCFGDTRGCDAFVPLGATCIDPETNEYSNYFSSTCDCAGCLLCDETDDFAPAVDACDSGGGGASLEISTEAALRAALAVGAPCTKVALGGDMALGEAATMARAVRLVGAVRIVGADGPARPVLSPASGPHRLVTVMNQAFVSLTSVILRDGFDAFAGGCIFVARGSAITLDRVALENCAAGAAGGGVAMWTAASLRASRSSFDGNAALMVGGSLYGHNRATIVLTDATTVENSSSVVGGGVAVLKAGSLEVAKASRIEACSARVNGGGAYIGRDSVMTVSSGSAVATSHAEFRGGGLFSHFFSTVVLEGRCVFANCTAHAGGGMQISNGAVLQASDSTFVGCVGTTVGGGGIDMGTGGTGGGTFGTFATVDFYRCTAPTGGGGGLALVTASSATLTNSRFFDCTAGAAGGAVATFAAGVSVALKQTVFTACHAAGDGGAFFLAQDCRASIDASTFSDSTAGGDGGAIATSAASKLAVFGGTRVERNVAARGGGGLALRATSNVGVANVVIADNVAVGGGGGAATAGAGATLHLGRVTLLRGNVAAVDGGAVEIFGRGAHLYVSASCSFVQVTLDWNAATLDAPEASVSLDYDGAPAGPGRDARGLRTTFSPQNGAAEIFEGCLPPGRGYELWASSVNGRSWVRGSWALTLPPHGASILSSVDNRLTFVQAVNEYGVLGVSAAAAHGALAAKFHLDEDGASFDAAADGGAAVRIVGNVAIAGDGGGFSVALEGHAVVYEALFEANVALAGSGGAVDVGAQSKADLQGIIAVANVAYRDGGAVAVNTLSEFNIYNSTATANVAGKRGGFASLERVRAVSLRSVVARGNRAAERGGALALVICDQAPPVVVVANSTFDRNSAALGSGAIDIGARSVVSACGARSSPILRVEGATLFTGNSVDAGNGGGIAVRPTGASLALASQPETCIAVLRVVVDWRRNAARCEIIGAIPGSVDGAVEKSCDMVPSNCDALRTFAGVARCNGCTCKTSQPGAGESFFRVDHVANSNSARTEAAPLFVGEPDAGAAKEFEYCLGAGSYEIVAYDRRGAAWFGGTLEATLWNFDGFEPTYRATAAWSPSGLETDPVGFVVGAADPVDLAVRFVDNKALKGGGAAVYYDVEAPAGLEAAETYSMDNAAAYSSFAATPAVQLLINTTFATAYAVPNAAMPAISAVLVDSYGQVVRSDSTTVVNARFIDNNQGTVKAWGLVAVCVRGVATFDMITITGLPGDTHQLRFLSPIAALETAPLPVELTPCPVGFVERADGAAAVSCIPCKYTEYYIRGRCVPCPRGAACDRYEPLDASSARVGYQLFTVETLPIKRGFYRFFATSEEIYECADEVYCSANECSCAGVGYEAAFHDPTLTHGAQLCAAHSEGPLCALCGTGRYPRPSSLGQGGGCAKCDGNSVLPIFFAVVIAAFLAMLAVVCAAAIACSGIARTRRRVLRAASFVRSRWFVVAAVQVWYAISTVSRFVAIENVDYPEPLQTVLQYLGFISLDLSFVISSMKCYYYMSYFELFLAWTLFPLAFGVLLAIGVAAVAAARVRGPPWPNEVLRYVTRTDAGRSTRRTATSLFWLVLVLLHNYICSLMFTFYSCSERFAVSEKRREQWLAYDYEVRCGSDAYHTFEGAAATLLVLYVLVVPASMALKLKLNRRAGRSDGALAFFTRHVRPAVWYYEIVALEVRLLICGALVPVTSRGLRLSIILVVICAWTTVTREMRPYINRGHMALTTYLQIFILSCVALALILYGDFLSEVAAKIFSWIVSAISVAITVRLYSAFKGEEVNKVLDLVRSRHAFARDDFLRLHVGMNVRVMDDVVFAAALAILDDEFMERPTKAAQAAGAAAAPGWAYLTVHLLPLRDVWTRAVRTRTLLATHAPRLLANAALLVRTRARSAPAAGGLVTLDQFAKAVDAVLGPLAQELRGDVVAATFSRFSVATEPRPTLDLDECFEPAMREILDALIRDHTTDEDDDDRRRSSSLDYTAKISGSLRRGSLRRESLHRALSKQRLPAEASSVLDTPSRTDAELRDDDGVEQGARGGAGKDRASRMQLLQLRPIGRRAEPESPRFSAPQKQARSAAEATSLEPDEAGTDRSHKDTFFDLAMHAHAANFKCWMVMEEAAAATLAEPDWGARINELQDFSDGPSAVLQAPLFGTHLAAWAAELGGNAGGEAFNALREHFDEAVLPHALRSVALAAHPAFIAALRALMCVPGADDSDDGDLESPQSLSWFSKCELYKSDSATAVKSTARMRAKVEEYRSSEDGLPASASWPHAARITDPLRATIVCNDAEAIVRAYAALRGGGADGDGAHSFRVGGADGDGAHPFRVTRLKNKLALCTKPFNLHVNCLFDRGDGAAPITTEIQFVPRAVNVVTSPSHKFYTLSRAPNADALAS